LAPAETAVSEDTERGKNVRLVLTLPRAGAYYLSLADANDQGGPFHRYRVVMSEGK